MYVVIRTRRLLSDDPDEGYLEGRDVLVDTDGESVFLDIEDARAVFDAHKHPDVELGIYVIGDLVRGYGPIQE